MYMFRSIIHKAKQLNFYQRHWNHLFLHPQHQWTNEYPPPQQAWPQLHKHVFVRKIRLAPHQTHRYLHPNCFSEVSTSWAANKPDKQIWFTFQQTHKETKSNNNIALRQTKRFQLSHGIYVPYLWLQFHTVSEVSIRHWFLRVPWPQSNSHSNSSRNFTTSTLMSGPNQSENNNNNITSN